MGTENVKLGVCDVTLGGVNLGYTKGGVSVEVTTDTHKVTVDQFGESEVNEYIMKRSVKVSVPMAETTLENLVKIMPGATLVETGGTNATGTITFADQPTEADTITINGVVFTFKASPALTNDVQIGVDLATTLGTLVTDLNASVDVLVMPATYSENGTILTITYDLKSVAGDSFTLAASSDTVSAGTLAGGVNSQKRVDVTNGIGADLLSTSQLLSLHPSDNAPSDVSEDFTVFKAATAGALNFAYKVDEERVYNVEFTGYPDTSAGNKLFAIGDLGA
ncbi:MAG: hypothetical protein HRT93_03080 [Piscirickettsiaceae bacterium]|nr:hypothetical protein [Piscirickettsiaceae bacterium]